MSHSLLKLFDVRIPNSDPALFPGFDFYGSGVSDSLTSLPPSANICSSAV